MPSQLLKKLGTEGKVRKQKAGLVQVEALLKEAILDLREAGKIVRLAERATYLPAYHAILKAGRALMLMKGYAPRDGAQHKTVVEVTCSIMGDKYRDLIDQFDTMRRKRNEMAYEAGTLLSKSESRRAFADAIALVQKILSEAKTQNPQLELTFGVKEEG